MSGGISSAYAKASLEQLSQLNPYVSVSVVEGPITDETLAGFSVAVFLGKGEAELARCNDLCRSRTPQVGFIAADCLGLCATAFVDFGDAFSVRDKDGEEPRSAIVAGITQEPWGCVRGVCGCALLVLVLVLVFVVVSAVFAVVPSVVFVGLLLLLLLFLLLMLPLLLQVLLASCSRSHSEG